MYVPRTAADTLERLAHGYPVIAVTGPRQSGKTTLVRRVFGNKPYVSLETPDQRQFAQEDPRRFLARYPDGAVLDEAQRCPELFSYLQSVVDEDGRSGLFILTGSQQLGLMAGISQSLAGRVALVPLLPFSLAELQAAGRAPETVDQLLTSGLYPPVHDRDLDPAVWYGNYVNTYLERDVRALLNVRDLGTFQRFLGLCAGRTGQLVNASALANQCGITHNTAKAWLSVLEAGYLVHLLKPHYRNFNRRLVKTPKLYFLDAGLAASLLGIQDPHMMAMHPLRGALFETWVVGELLKSRFHRGKPSNLFFWRDRSGNEVDLILELGPELVPIEIKSGETVTRDYFKGLDRWEALSGDARARKWVVYGGSGRQARGQTEVLPWTDLSVLDHLL